MAQVRAAFHDARGTLGRALRIDARRRRVSVETIVKPVRTPLPGITDRIVKPETVRLVGGHRSRAAITVLGGVLFGKPPLPDITAVLIRLVLTGL